MAEAPKKAGELDPTPYYRPDLIAVVSNPSIPEGPLKESERITLGEVRQRYIKLDHTTNPYTLEEGMDVYIDNSVAEVIVRLPAVMYGYKPINIFPLYKTYSLRKLTILRNGHKIGAVADDAEVTTDGLAIRLNYIDATYGVAVSAIS